jgi:hypothetical protein
MIADGVTRRTPAERLRFLDAVVYPNIPPNLLIAGVVAVRVFESMDLRPACPCPTFTRMNKRPQGYAGGDATEQICRLGYQELLPPLRFRVELPTEQIS